MAVYRTRSIERAVADLFAELPALLLTGPRAAGKTTTAARFAATVVRLDHPGEATAFRADPDAALRGLPEPVLLDEWQAVPGVLGAVKRTVDADPRPGRFLLTGSVRADLDATVWPGTGRVVRLAMYPMTVAEITGRAEVVPSLIDRLAGGDPLEPSASTPDLRGYVELALQGGFPEPVLALGERTRRAWIASYIDQLLTHDVEQLAEDRDPARLRRYFEAYALNSAGLVEDKTLYEAAGINRKTALAYERLLTNLVAVDRVPAWTTNRLKRLVLSPKRYLVDSSLLGGILGAGVPEVMRDGDLLGRVLDTFVAAQLRAEVAVAETRPRLYHLRQEQGRHEVDLLAELGGERVVGIEVKADSAPSHDAGRHLAWLRDELGDRFLGGVVLHTGPRTYRVADGIVAAPISTLWASAGG
ncbi:MAG: ATP-binding protein [Acidimicrobiia bacterium]